LSPLTLEREHPVALFDPFDGQIFLTPSLFIPTPCRRRGIGRGRPLHRPHGPPVPRPSGVRGLRRRQGGNLRPHHAAAARRAGAQRGHSSGFTLSASSFDRFPRSNWTHLNQWSVSIFGSTANLTLFLLNQPHACALFKAVFFSGGGGGGLRDRLYPRCLAHAAWLTHAAWLCLHSFKCLGLHQGPRFSDPYFGEHRGAPGVKASHAGRPPRDRAVQ